VAKGLRPVLPRFSIVMRTSWGAVYVEVAPAGGVEVRATPAIPGRSAPASPTGSRARLCIFLTSSIGAAGIKSFLGGMHAGSLEALRVSRPKAVDLECIKAGQPEDRHSAQLRPISDCWQIQLRYINAWAVLVGGIVRFTKTISGIIAAVITHLFAKYTAFNPLILTPGARPTTFIGMHVGECYANEQHSQ